MRSSIRQARPAQLVTVFQPEGSNLCGQAVVATIARISLEEAKIAFRAARCPVGLTGIRHLVTVLEAMGFRVWTKLEGRRLRKGSLDPDTGRTTLHGTWICRMRWKGRWKTHWVVVEDGRVFDPGLEERFVDGLAEGLTHDEIIAANVRETGAYLSTAYPVVGPGTSSRGF